MLLLRSHHPGMKDGKGILRHKRDLDATPVAGSSGSRQRYAPDANTISPIAPFTGPNSNGTLKREKQALQLEPDGAILCLARAPARQAAREDHARECADKARENETSRDLRPLLD